jgi:CRP-like cAMP-binding protein
VLTILQPGEVFGEIALLDGADRTADARAVSDCELMVLDHRDLPAASSRADHAP